jgi:hypothetical protein
MILRKLRQKLEFKSTVLYSLHWGYPKSEKLTQGICSLLLHAMHECCLYSGEPTLKEIALPLCYEAITVSLFTDGNDLFQKILC